MSPYIWAGLILLCVPLLICLAVAMRAPRQDGERYHGRHR